MYLVKTPHRFVPGRRSKLHPHLTRPCTVAREPDTRPALRWTWRHLGEPWAGPPWTHLAFSMQTFLITCSRKGESANSFSRCTTPLGPPVTPCMHHSPLGSWTCQNCFITSCHSADIPCFMNALAFLHENVEAGGQEPPRRPLGKETHLPSSECNLVGPFL